MTNRVTKEGCTVYPIVIPTQSGLKSFNFYLVQKGDSLTLIDAGIDTEECWTSLNQTLNEQGFSVSDLTQVLVTHNHHDHVGLINRIAALKDLPIYAHPEAIYRLKRDKEFFSMRVDFFDQLYEEMGCGEAGKLQVQRLRDAVAKNKDNAIHSEIIPLLDTSGVSGWQVMETPGHSPDHVVFFDKKRRWLFAGDHLLQHISSNAMIEPDRHGGRGTSLLDYAQSLHQCSQLDLEILFTGHGDFIYDYKDLIASRLQRMKEKAEKFLRIIEKGTSTASDLAQLCYRHKYQSEFALVMSEIIGHLDYLEANNKVHKVKKNGVWYYSSM